MMSTRIPTKILTSKRCSRCKRGGEKHICSLVYKTPMRTKDPCQCDCRKKEWNQ